MNRKVLTLTTSKAGDKILQQYLTAGWEVTSATTKDQGWDFGRTCCLGAIFLPLALLGKNKPVTTYILQREY